MKRARDRSIHSLKSLLLAAAAGVFLASCDQSGVGNNGDGVVKQTDIVAGSGEKNFAEKYHLKLALPMPETEFTALLKHLKLQYDVYGERDTDREVPPPRQSKFVDASKMQKVYQIYGDRDMVRRIGEYYWAYVDMNHQVVYIENEFAYTGP